MNPFALEASKMAVAMLDLERPEQLPAELTARIVQAELLARKLGGSLVSRQVVAALVATYLNDGR